MDNVSMVRRVPVVDALGYFVYSLFTLIQYFEVFFDRSKNSALNDAEIDADWQKVYLQGVTTGSSFYLNKEAIIMPIEALTALGEESVLIHRRDTISHCNRITEVCHQVWNLMKEIERSRGGQRGQPRIPTLTRIIKNIEDIRQMVQMFLHNFWN